jgi:prepilin-type N-terminal cleavage/methylation domain-containing protein
MRNAEYLMLKTGMHLVAQMSSREKPPKAAESRDPGLTRGVRCSGPEVPRLRDAARRCARVDIRDVRFAICDLRVGRGFTLLELVLVMLIMATLLAVAVPSLSGFGAGRQLDQSAVQVVAVANWARDRAIQEGRVYRLNMDAAAGSYWVTMQLEGEFVSPEVEFGRVFVLPEPVTCSWVAPHVDGGVGYMQFFPTGRIEQTTMELVNRQGQVRMVGALSAAERFSVIEVTETVW